MAHLSTCIFVGHARQKTERCSVGRDSQQADKEQADDNVRRLGDQIRMIQYVRGRIGEDRGTILDIGRIPGYDTRFPTSSAPLQGKKRGPPGRWQELVEPREPAPRWSSEDPPGGRRVPYGSTTATGVLLPIAPAMSDGDGRQGVKRIRQHEWSNCWPTGNGTCANSSDTTVTSSKSFTPLTPPTEVKAETDDLFLANVTASLTT